MSHWTRREDLVGARMLEMFEVVRYLGVMSEQSGGKTRVQYCCMAADKGEDLKPELVLGGAAMEERVCR